MRRHAPGSMWAARVLPGLLAVAGVVWIVGGVVDVVTVDRAAGVVFRAGGLIRAGGVGVLMTTLGVSLVIGPGRVLAGSRGGRSAAAVARLAGRVFRGIRWGGAGCVAVVVSACAAMAASGGAAATVSGWAGHVGAVLMASAFAESLVLVYRPSYFKFGDVGDVGVAVAAPSPADRTVRAGRPINDQDDRTGS